MWFVKFGDDQLLTTQPSQCYLHRKCNLKVIPLNGCSHRNSDGNQKMSCDWNRLWECSFTLKMSGEWGTYGCYFLPSHLGCRVKLGCALEVIHKFWSPCQTCIKRIQNIYTLCIAYGIEYIGTKKKHIIVIWNIYTYSFDMDIME